ncbi:hypothetical protein [uncultured Roseobacter sp.]|uniref:hypothetical protein n=1 Tax=uncultured Roseobacter sp. TaxID=114847 RepID=UPI00262F7C11|nr:hypothetical protein [uncultured Roseobacter sp.]
MFTSALSFFWPTFSLERAAAKPPQPRPAPIFIGDAVQPWGGETMLLQILRHEAETKD